MEKKGGKEGYDPGSRPPDDQRRLVVDPLTNQLYYTGNGGNKPNCGKLPINRGTERNKDVTFSCVRVTREQEVLLPPVLQNFVFAYFE